MSDAVSRSSPLAWVQAGLLAANLGFTTLSLGGLSAETVVITSLLTWASFTLLLLRVGWADEGGAVKLQGAGWCFVPFLAYVVINVGAVTPVRWLGWSDAWNWAQLVVTFWVALEVVRTEGPRRFLVGTILTLGVVLVGMAAYQRFFDPHWLMLGRTQADQFVGRGSGAFGIPNSCAAWLVLVIPPALAAIRNQKSNLGKTAAAGLVVVFIFGLVLTVSRGAWISLGVALVLWPLAMRGRSWASRLRGASWVGAAIVGIGLVLYAAVPGVHDRFEILWRDSGERSRPMLWRGAWQLWSAAPVTGTGGGSYAVLFERYRPERFNDNPRWAHSDYLNTLSDYGVLGFGLFFGACGWLIWRTRRRNEATRRRGVGVGLLAFGLTLGLDFHLKIPALAMLVACSAAAYLQSRGEDEDKQRRGRAELRGWGTSLSAAVISLVFLGMILPRHRAEAQRQSARASVDELVGRPNDVTVERATLEAAYLRLSKAAAVDSENAQIWSDLAYVVSLQARHDSARALALGAEAEAAARQALVRSKLVPEFWWRLGVALDTQGRWIEAGRAFTRATEIAPHSARSWYHRAYHLSLQAGFRDEALSNLAVCLRLDPGWRVAELLREQLAARTPP